MTPADFHRVVRRHLDQLVRTGLIGVEAHAAIAARYAITRWDWHSLSRWFLIFGALTFAGGVFLFVRDLLDFTLEKLAMVLTLAIVVLFSAARGLMRHERPMTARALELLGGLAIIGLTLTLGAIFDTGSGDWPSLLLFDLVILLPLAYWLVNVLLLVLTVVVFFVWFGGVTGYASGWGMYWFGMNYPMRFLGISLLMIGAALLHREAEVGWLWRYRGFFKVWLSAGVYLTEMALWLLSLFGNYGRITSFSHQAGAWELWLFNGLWAGANVVLMGLGARYALTMLRGYAITFLVIQGYTVFFWHVAGHLGQTLSLIVAGASTLWLLMYLERTRRASLAR